MKKLALFTIIVLIFGTMSPSLVNNAYGQNDPSILLRIAVQADKQIVNQLDKKYENKIPNNINILYEKGNTAVKSLDRSLSNNDIEKAKQDFLLAMNSFMQISRIMSQSSEKIIVTESEQPTNILSKIDRLEKYVKSLETISKKYDIDVKDDFNKIDNLIQKLRDESNEQNFDYKTIFDKIEFLCNSIKNDIRESAIDKRSDFIKQFFDKLLNKIDKILIQAENDGMDESQIKLGHELVVKTKEFLSKNQIENAKVSYADLKKLLHNMGYSINFR